MCIAAYRYTIMSASLHEPYPLISSIVRVVVYSSVVGQTLYESCSLVKISDMHLYKPSITIYVTRSAKRAFPIADIW